MRREPKDDITGVRFGRLLGVRFFGFANRRTWWVCKCDCGNIVKQRVDQLKSGNTMSCGCLAGELTRRRFTTHGASRRGHSSESYKTWKTFTQRCSPKNSRRKDYFDRGIYVCDRWKVGEGDKSGFECFIEDIGCRPSPRHSLERRDNDGPYSPENCRWALPKEQGRNRRSNRKVNFRGRKMALTEACELASLPYYLVHGRIVKLKWSTERALTTPVMATGVKRGPYRPRGTAKFSRYPERDAARSLLSQAIKTGKLLRPAACQWCGSSPPPNARGASAIHGHHHRGYSDPLDVIWLCNTCHMDADAGARQSARWPDRHSQGTSTVART